MCIIRISHYALPSWRLAPRFQMQILLSLLVGALSAFVVLFTAHLTTLVGLDPVSWAVATATLIIVACFVLVGAMIYEKVDSLKTTPSTHKETLEG